jgi:hypothetical protein
MRRSVLLLAGAAITGALVIYPAVHSVPSAHAQSGECSSFPGYLQIQAGNSNMYVRSEGPSTAVKMEAGEAGGSCYKPTYAGTYEGHNMYTYFNQDDRCLYWNDSGSQEVFTAANADGCSDQPNEEFFGINYVSGSGWNWRNMAAMNDAYGPILGVPCADNGFLITGDYLTNCETWNFPSDGG